MCVAGFIIERSRYLDRTWEQKVRSGFWEAYSPMFFQTLGQGIPWWSSGWHSASTSGGWAQSLVWNRDPACHTVRPKQKQTKRKNSRVTAAGHTQKTIPLMLCLGNSNETCHYSKSFELV